MMTKSRRKFIKSASLLTICATPVINIFSQNVSQDDVKSPLDRSLVEEFVRVAHSDQKAVERMLSEEPHLLNAVHDWGNGDFESATGAAGHMGNKALAEFLISQGARADMFVLAMLGKEELVKSWLALYPHLINSIGAHGFTLLHYAEKGGADSASLVTHLTQLGLTERFIPTY